MCRRSLLSHSEDQLKTARAQLFEDAKHKRLAHPKDILVKRLKCAVGPKKKYALDVGELIYAVKNNLPGPRALLKNGKRSATGFADSLSTGVIGYLASPVFCIPVYNTLGYCVPPHEISSGYTVPPNVSPRKFCIPNNNLQTVSVAQGKQRYL